MVFSSDWLQGRLNVLSETNQVYETSEQSATTDKTRLNSEEAQTRHIYDIVLSSILGFYVLHLDRNSFIITNFSKRVSRTLGTKRNRRTKQQEKRSRVNRRQPKFLPYFAETEFPSGWLIQYVPSG